MDTKETQSAKAAETHSNSENLETSALSILNTFLSLEEIVLAYTFMYYLLLLRKREDTRDYPVSS